MSSPGIRPKSSQTSIKVMIDTVEWGSVSDSFGYSLINVNSTYSVLPSSMISRLWMPAMRAWAKGSGITPVEVVEASVYNLPVLSSWPDDTPRVGKSKCAFSIVWRADKKSVENTRVVSNQIKMLRHLDSRLSVISSFEIVEFDPSHLFADSAVSVALPACVSIEVGLNRRILPERVLFVWLVVDHWLTWVSSRLHSMENSESISTHRVRGVILEITDSVVFRTNV